MIITKLTGYVNTKSKEFVIVSGLLKDEEHFSSDIRFLNGSYWVVFSESTKTSNSELLKKSTLDCVNFNIYETFPLIHETFDGRYYKFVKLNTFNIEINNTYFK